MSRLGNVHQLFSPGKTICFILMVKLYLPKFNCISTTYILTRPIIAILFPSSVPSQARSIIWGYLTIIFYKQDLLLLNLKVTDHSLTISNASTSQSHTFTTKYQATAHTITNYCIYPSIYSTAHTGEAMFGWNYLKAL